jgi:hypothetical protein
MFEIGLRDGREWIVGSLSLADFALATTEVGPFSETVWRLG